MATATRKVFKFIVPVDDESHMLTIPNPAVLLDAYCPAVAADEVWVWFEVLDGPSIRTTERTFRIFGTGHPIPDGLFNYRRTTVHPLTGLVWHLYEIGVEEW